MAHLDNSQRSAAVLLKARRNRAYFARRIFVDPIHPEGSTNVGEMFDEELDDRHPKCGVLNASLLARLAAILADVENDVALSSACEMSMESRLMLKLRGCGALTSHERPGEELLEKLRA